MTITRPLWAKFIHSPRNLDGMIDTVPDLVEELVPEILEAIVTTKVGVGER